MLCSLANANPFTSNKSSPTPVLQEKPDDFVITTMTTLSNKLAGYIDEWKQTGHIHTILLILLISFAYGFIHALAPGHRKIVVFSYFLAKKSRFIEPLFVSLALAFVHAFTALLLLFIFSGVSGALSVATNNASIYLEGITYIILILISIYGFIEGVISLLRTSHSEEKKKISLVGVILSGLYPCPAALLILVFTVNLNCLWLGVFAILSLSLGMSIPIMISAYLAWCGRTTLVKKLTYNESTIKRISSVLQILAFALLLYISVKISLPFIVGLLS